MLIHKDDLYSLSLSIPNTVFNIMWARICSKSVSFSEIALIIHDFMLKRILINSCNIFSASFCFCFDRSFMKRSLSDGNILRESNNTPVSRCNVGHKRIPNSAMSDRTHQVGDAQNLSTPEISACGSDVSYSRLAFSVCRSCRGLPLYSNLFDVCSSIKET